MSKAKTELTLESLQAQINELKEALANMPKPRDRGPKSDRPMTEDDAERILFGDLKDVSHKKCAIELGLSYGQVYSARTGHTFLPQYRGSEWEAKQDAKLAK